MVETVATLESYFYEKIQPASLDGDVKAYLVMCLASWATREPSGDETLGIEYMRAVQERSWTLRAVGDRALYWAGVVPHSMGPLVTRRYVEDIGSSAFARLADDIESEMFWSLSESFRDATDLLYEASRLQGESVEVLIERAKTTADERDEELLREQGVILLRPRS